MLIATVTIVKNCIWIQVLKNASMKYPHTVKGSCHGSIDEWLRVA
jgi:hypothetical protein